MPKRIYHCENCNTEFTPKDKRFAKFCSYSCSTSYNNLIRPSATKETRDKIRQSLIKHHIKIGTYKKKDTKEQYKIVCDFKFNPYLYSNIPGYNLLLERGIYHHLNNFNGVVRDHIMSKEYGWKNNIDPKLLSHPANCQFLTWIDNYKKGSETALTEEELITRIKEWDNDKQLKNVSSVTKSKINHELLTKISNIKNQCSSISEIARKVGCHRHTAKKYLTILQKQ